jgi:hypothetical protein
MSRDSKLDTYHQYTVIWIVCLAYAAICALITLMMLVSGETKGLVVMVPMMLVLAFVSIIYNGKAAHYHNILYPRI